MDLSPLGIVNRSVYNQIPIYILCNNLLYSLSRYHPYQPPAKRLFRFCQLAFFTFLNQRKIIHIISVRSQRIFCSSLRSIFIPQGLNLIFNRSTIQNRFKNPRVLIIQKTPESIGSGKTVQIFTHIIRNII